MWYIIDQKKKQRKKKKVPKEEKCMLVLSFCPGGSITTVKALITRMLCGLVRVFPEADPEIRM